MTKVLIVSVGGSSELIVNAILQSKPDFVYFLCSTGKSGSDETVATTIVPRAQLAADSFSVERVHSPDELRDVVGACARIEADLDERFTGNDLTVVANYTEGTKSMSAGLVVLAQRRGWVAEVTERPNRPWSGPVSRVGLAAVTVFSHLELSCSQGINVFIGENGTGKTHLLKSMYALLRAAEEAETQAPLLSGGDKFARMFPGRVHSFFAGENEPSRVSLECLNPEGGSSHYERVETAGAPAEWSLPASVATRALFLPSRESLAMYPGFVPAYERWKLSFDETYYDLCKELGQIGLREQQPEFVALLEELEGIIGGPVRFDGDVFVVDARWGPIRAHMVSEGHRKLACLAYLIKNGALTAKSVLFWDEPEANLNAKVVTVVATMLRKLADAGVQIFMATHDYLLARELSLAVQYRIPPSVDTIFFALHRPSAEAPVEVESNRLWSHLDHNPIVEEYSAHYDREQDMFAGDSPEEPS